MEIKVTIGFDERAISILTRLTEALSRPQTSADTSNTEPTPPVETETPKKKSKAAQEKKVEEPNVKDAEVETEDEDISVENLRLLLATAKRNGHIDAIKSILGDYGVALLSDLKAEYYGAVAKRVRAL